MTTVLPFASALIAPVRAVIGPEMRGSIAIFRMACAGGETERLGREVATGDMALGRKRIRSPRRPLWLAKAASACNLGHTRTRAGST
jgi:hypothetical protein